MENFAFLWNDWSNKHILALLEDDELSRSLCIVTTLCQLEYKERVSPAYQEKHQKLRFLLSVFWEGQFYFVTIYVGAKKFSLKSVLQILYQSIILIILLIVSKCSTYNAHLTRHSSLNVFTPFP